MITLQTTGHGITVVDVPAPQPGEGEVAIRVAASAINPVDLMFAAGDAHRAGWVPPDAAIGTGWDVAGVVDEVGPGVADLRPGDRVAGLDARVGAPVRGHSDVVVLPAADLARVPEGLSLADAGAIVLNALTADQAVAALGPGAGRDLLVTGAAGGVGAHAVVEGVRAGFRVFGLARPSDAARLGDLGATPVAEAEPRRYDAVIDAAALGAIGAVRDGGQIVGLLGVAPLVAERGVTVHQMLVRPDGARLTALLADAAAGPHRETVLGTFPRSRAVAAFEAAAAPGQRGRWLLVAD